jgi:hypothetical protein
MLELLATLQQVMDIHQSLVMYTQIRCSHLRSMDQTIITMMVQPHRGNSFVNFAVHSMTLTARSNNGTLSLAAGTGITISTNSSANSITISYDWYGKILTNFAVSGQSTVPKGNNANTFFVCSWIWNKSGQSALAGTITFTSTGTGGGGGGSGTYGTLYGTNDVTKRNWRTNSIHDKFF